MPNIPPHLLIPPIALAFQALNSKKLGVILTISPSHYTQNLSLNSLYSFQSPWIFYLSHYYISPQPYIGHGIQTFVEFKIKVQ